MSQPWDILLDSDFEWLIYFIELIPQLQDEGRKYWSKILSDKRISPSLCRIIQHEAFNSCPANLELVTAKTLQYFFPQFTEEQFNDIIVAQNISKHFANSEPPHFSTPVLIFSDICSEVINTLRTDWLGTPDLLGFDWFLFVYYYPKILPLSLGLTETDWAELAHLIYYQLLRLEYFLNDVTTIQSFSALLEPSIENVLTSWSNQYQTPELSPYIFAPLPYNLELVNQIWSCIISPDASRPTYLDSELSDIFIELPLAQAAWNRLA